MKLAVDYQEGSTYSNTLSFLIELFGKDTEAGNSFCSSIRLKDNPDEYSEGIETVVKRNPSNGAFFQVQEGDVIKIKYPKLY